MTQVEGDTIEIDGDRFYEYGNDKYPSVTTVTGTHPSARRAIDGWQKKLIRQGRDPDKVRDTKALLGTLVHHRILDPLAMRPLPIPEIDMDLVYDGIETDIETCLALWEECNFEVADDAYIEESLVSHEHGYAGTADMISGRTVVDLKTSKSVYETHKMQVSAYVMAAREMSDLPSPKDAAIIGLHPDPANNIHMKPKVERLNERDVEYWFGEFLDLLENFDG